MSEMADLSQHEEEFERIDPALVAEAEGTEQKEPEIETEDVLMLGDEELSPDSEEDDADEPVEEEIDGKPAPTWVKELRKNSKEMKRELKRRDAELEELRQRVANNQSEPVHQTPVVVQEPVYPTLESVDWDEDKHREAVAEYTKQYARFERHKEEQQKTEQMRVLELQSRLETYKQKRQSVKLKDFAQAEGRAIKQLPSLVQDMILESIDDNPELVVYAIGKNPKLLEFLKTEKNPARIAAKLGWISGKAQIAPRAKQRVETEPQVRGGGASTHHLDKLHQEAQTSGDWTEYFAAKRKINK